MIIDIQKGGFAKGLIEYHEKKVGEGKGELLYNNILVDSTPEKVNVFLDTANENPKIRTNKFLHISVSFNQQDGPIEPEKMAQIGLTYLQEMGISDTPVLIYQHSDKRHQHFHIVTTTMDYSGNKIPDAHDHFRSQRLSRKLEKELGLIQTKYSSKAELRLQEINATKYRIYNSIQGLKMNPLALDEMGEIINSQELETIYHQRLSDYEIQKGLLERGITKDRFNVIWRTLNKHDLISKTHKENIMERIAQLKQLSKSRDEYLNRVEQAGIYIRRIATRSGGYSLTYGLPEHNFYVKESSMPVAFRYDYLYTGKSLTMSFDREQQRKYLSRLVKRALYESDSKGMFEKVLADNNIHFEYASNARGVYGVSFRSGNVAEPETFKGSELDRSLSWSSISKKLDAQASVSQTDKQQERQSPAIPAGPVIKRLMENEEDEETRKRRRQSDQDQDIIRD